MSSQQEIEPTLVPGTIEVVEASEDNNAVAAPLARQLPPIYRNRDYMILWSGQVISNLGSGVSGIVFPLLILALTGSPAVAGVATALGQFPYLIFSLPVGALIDRWDRKRVMIICDLGRGLAMAAIPVAVLFNALTIWQIFIVAFIEGSLFVFFNIAQTAALPNVVAREQLPQATAQNAAADGLTGIVGPSLGTLIYQNLGRAMPFVVDAVSYGVSVVSLALIKTRFQTQRVATGQRHLLREIREGLAWLWNQPLIRFIAFLTGGMNFVGAGMVLIVIVLAKNIGATDGEIGFVFSIGAIGGIVGSLIGGQIQKRFAFGQVIIGSVVVQTIVFPLLLFAPNLVVMGILLAAMWIVGPIYNIVQFSYRLSLIPDELQGRVNSTFRLVAFGFQPVGAALSGLLLEKLDAPIAVAAFASVMVLLLAMTILYPPVRNARPIAHA